MLLDKQPYRYAEQDKLRYDRFGMRIDTEDIEEVVCRDLLDKRRYSLNSENKLKAALHKLLDTRSKEGDSHNRHENTRYKEERLERKLDGEIADRDKDRCQDDDRDRNAQPKPAIPCDEI